MIKKPACETLEADLGELLRFGHRRMRTLGHEHVETSNTTLAKNFVHERKKKVGVVVARFVGNNGEDTFAALDYVKSFVDDLSGIHEFNSG